ncbi:serine O-acetyltransferase EpsC [Streptosporangium sandarakinum]
MRARVKKRAGSGAPDDEVMYQPHPEHGCPAEPAPRGDRPRGLLRTLEEDLRTIVERDPSIRNRREALLHPVLPAMLLHRVAHRLYRRDRRLAARFLMLLARGFTGVEIHPGAVLGRRVFVDHGAAVVIGETAVVGDDVTIYHQVTLGAVGWWRDNRRAGGERRHPVIGDRVVLGVGATVLGPVRVGDDAVIGARALVLGDVPAGARALAPVRAVTPGAPRPPGTPGTPGSRPDHSHAEDRPLVGAGAAPAVERPSPRRGQAPRPARPGAGHAPQARGGAGEAAGMT